MAVKITRIGYQSVLEAAEEEPGLKRCLDTKGHKVIVIIEADEVSKERLSKATERLLDDILKA